ncbi:MAG: hypothetical protein WA177_01045, partial [Xanthobacteraceae bacterium]
FRHIHACHVFLPPIAAASLAGGDPHPAIKSMPVTHANHNAHQNRAQHGHEIVYERADYSIVW